MLNLVKIFKALSDQNRVMILKMLESRPLCVCEIPGILKLSVSTVSKHLSILRDAELINDQKSGKWVFYSLNTNSKNIQVRQLLSLFPMWLNDDDTITSNFQMIKDIDSIKECNL